MTLYSDVPVYRETYNMLLDIERMQESLPRTCKYTLGQQLVSDTVEILMLIFRAQQTSEKAPIISHMRETLHNVQVKLRILCDLHHISEKRYMFLAEQSVSISKQLSRWHRYSCQYAEERSQAAEKKITQHKKEI